jgi:hypothetical protein
LYFIVQLDLEKYLSKNNYWSFFQKGWFWVDLHPNTHGSLGVNGEDVPTSKKRGQPSKGRKASAPPKKKKVQQRKQQRKWWIWMEVQAQKKKDLLGSGEITRSKRW